MCVAMKRRYACHRLYVAPYQYYSKGVVELDEKGKVIGAFRLEGEISATLWIGGIVFVASARCPVWKQGELFSDFLQRIAVGMGGDRYAWYISEFDFLKEEFTARSKLCRL